MSNVKNKVAVYTVNVDLVPDATSTDLAAVRLRAQEIASLFNAKLTVGSTKPSPSRAFLKNAGQSCGSGPMVTFTVEIPDRSWPRFRDTFEGFFIGGCAVVWY